MVELDDFRALAIEFDPDAKFHSDFIQSQVYER